MTDTKTKRDADQSEDVYLSVLAAFDLNIANKSFEGTGAEFLSSSLRAMPLSS